MRKNGRTVKARAPAPRSKPTAATISDVARHAGVSPMTVSRVVNGEAGVRPLTRERVQAAIAALHYVPNPAARHLAGSELIRIGVLHGSARSGYLAEFLVGVMDQASLSHAQLVVQQCTDPSARPAEVRSLVAGGIDGLILPPPLCDEKALLDVAAAARVPTVVVGAGLPDKRADAVNIDDYEAALAMTRHLIALGHQRVGFIGGNPGQTASSCRLAGFRDAMAQAGLPLPAELMVPGLFNYRSGLDGAELLLALEPRPTAIFACNDDMAAATVAVAHRLGLDVPGDLTVVGCDDTAIATTIWPELTTIRQPITEMAHAAVNLLVRHVRALRAGTQEAPQQDRVPFEVVRRQSDAAPRQRPATRLASVVQPAPATRARRRG